MAKDLTIRTCLGCRESKQKNELLRFVLDPDLRVTPDLFSKLPGRGAYTCCRKSCIEAAIQRKQFSRSFRKEVICQDAASMSGMIATAMADRISSYISLANKAGKIITGSDKLHAALKNRQTDLLLLTTDISRDSAEKLIYSANTSGIEVCTFLTKDRLGALLGKEMRTAAALIPSGFVATIRSELIKYRNFFEGGAW